MDTKRLLALGLSLMLIFGVLVAVGVSVWQISKTQGIATVRGLIGSEKELFFKDPAVIEALRKAGLEVQIDTAGSRKIANSNLAGYDFVFPSGVPASEKIRRDQAGGKAYNTFFTPMAVASWQSIAKILEANGVASDKGGYYILNLAELLKLIQAGKRWNELKDNNDYKVNKTILIASTDVRSSNSAAMYLSLISYVVNNNNIAQMNEVSQIVPAMMPMFLGQGWQESSSQGPFDNYLVMGMGKAPLVMIYESQFIAAAREGSIRPEMVLMYPEPTIFTKHTLIALPGKTNGERLGALLSESDLPPDMADLAAVRAELLKLATKHGFRTNDLKAFREFAEANQLKISQDFVDVIDPPSYEVLEGLIVGIEQNYK